MKLECSGEKIKMAVASAERITGKNLTLPILNSILLVASDKTLKIRATNLSLGIEIEIPAKIEKEGVLAVKGSVLSGLLNAVSNETVSLEQKDENLSIKTKWNTALIKSHPHDDFPTIPRVSGTDVLVPTKKFIEGIQSVHYSSSPSDIKPEIASVYVYADNDSMVFVATDSFRLAEKKVKIKNISNFEPLIIPNKNVLEIMRALDMAGDEMNLSFTKNQIAISAPGLYLTSRIVDGIFPDYKQIIPKSSTTEITVLKQDLLQALKVSNIFSDKFNQINITASAKDKKLSIYAKNNDVGETTVTITSAMKGEDLEIGLNYKYFLDCFQSIPEDSLVLKCEGNSRPMIISGAGNNSFMYLIMPMNR